MDNSTKHTAAQVEHLITLIQETRDRQVRLEAALRHQPQTSDTLWAAAALHDMRPALAAAAATTELAAALASARYGDGWRAGFAAALKSRTPGRATRNLRAV